MKKNSFSYNTDLHRLELDDKPLFEGELIEIGVFGYWIPGNLALDSTGWYLMTGDSIGIRLGEGIHARRPYGTLHVVNTSHGHAAQR